MLLPDSMALVEPPLDVVPESERDNIMSDVHALGHFGAAGMVKSLQSRGLHWPNMISDCKRHVQQCSPCLKFNITARGFHPLQSITAALPFDHLAIDLIGPMPPHPAGLSYVLVIVDVCSRFVWLRALPDKTSHSIASTLFLIFSDFGFPKIIQSDNGTEFVNAVVKELLLRCNVAFRNVSPYHPRANGLAERHVRTTLQVLRKMLASPDGDWALHLPAVQVVINAKVHALHSSTPFSLMFGRPLNALADYTDVHAAPLSPSALASRMKILTDLVFPTINEKAAGAQASVRQRFDASNNITDGFPDGAVVMVLDPTRSKKLAPFYKGPYKIVRRNAGGAYVLADLLGAALPRPIPPSHLKLVSLS